MCKKFWNIASETLMQNVLLYLIILVKIIPNYFIFFFFFAMVMIYIPLKMFLQIYGLLNIIKHIEY